jgi:tripartite-type tricarboxylate transporter receptor subunit TctC
MYRVTTALWFLVLAHVSIVQAADSYPGRPVRIIVGFPAGGVTDVLARPIAQALSEKYGVQFVVENRPGATGQIANEAVVRAAPDGHTLLAAPGSSISSYPHMRKNMPYDSLKDLAPVAEIARFSYVLVRHPAVPAHNIKELVALAKSRHGELTYGSPGVGTAFHLSGKLLENMAKVDMVHVPYKGGAAAMTDMLGGRVDLLFYSLAVIQPLIDARKLYPIAVTGMKRMPQLPNVPTIDESGLPGYEMTGWQGTFMPAKTSQAIVAQLNVDINALLSGGALQGLWSSQGMEFVPNNVTQFTKIVRTDYERYASLIKTAGIKSE